MFNLVTMNRLPINIEQLIGGRVVENNRIEFKKGWNPNAIYRSVCAFANDFEDIGGGYIIIGVEAKNGRAIRPVYGVDLNQIDEIEQEIVRLNNFLDPYYMPTVCIEDVDDKKVIVMWITPSDRRPYKVPDEIMNKVKKYNYYIRYNSSSIIPHGEQEQELIALANKIPFDDRPNYKATIDDVSMSLVREFLAKTESKLLEEIKSDNKLDILKMMQLVEGPAENLQVKNIGLMMFSLTPDKFFPYGQVDIVIYPHGKDADPNDFIEAEPIKGPADYMITKAVDYLCTMVVRQRVKKVSYQQESIRTFNYPIEAIEEAVSNSIYHRSWDVQEPVEISVMPDHIEIINYGGADRSIRLEDLMSGKRVISRRYRNRRLGDYLKELHLTEGRGTGFPTIKRALELNGSPMATFDADADRTYFMISIPCREDFIQKELSVDKGGHLLPTGIETVEENNAHIDNELEEEIAQILVQERGSSAQIAHKISHKISHMISLINDNPEISTLEMAKIIGTSRRTATSYLQFLTGHSYINRVGDKRNGHREILDNK